MLQGGRQNHTSLHLPQSEQDAGQAGWSAHFPGTDGDSLVDCDCAAP